MPAYCRSRAGRVFRLIRSSELLDGDTVRYRLTAVAIPSGESTELSRDLDAATHRDKLSLGQAIPTPEATFEELWQQLQIDLDLGYA